MNIIQKSKKSFKKKQEKGTKISLKKKKKKGEKRTEIDIKIFLRKKKKEKHQHHQDQNKNLFDKALQKKAECMRNYYLAHKKKKNWGFYKLVYKLRIPKTNFDAQEVFLRFKNLLTDKK